jgi:hypothetical protein
MGILASRSPDKQTPQAHSLRGFFYGFDSCQRLSDKR